MSSTMPYVYCVTKHWPFVQCTHTHRVAYCEGKFPEFLLDAWDEYDYRKESDNDRPGLYSPLYCLL